MNGWPTIYKKELLEFARDRRVLFSAVLGPLLLEVLIFGLLGFVFSQVAFEQHYAVFVNDRKAAAPITAPLEMTGRFTVSDLPEGASVDELLKSQVAHVVLEFPEDFAERSAAGEAPTVMLISDANEQRSQIAKQIVLDAVRHFEEAEREERLKKQGVDPESLEALTLEERTAETGKAFGGTMMVGFLPYLIIIWAFYGCFSCVSDLVAGEKERGTLETLLVSPVSRGAVAFGKFLALATVSLVATVSALTGIIAMGLWKGMPASDLLFNGGLHISFASVLAIVAVLVPLIVFFAAGLLILSTLARNQREVQTYLSVVSFLVLIPAMMSQFLGFTDAATSAWIGYVPVLNTATVVRQALLEKIDAQTLLATIAVSVVLCGLALLTVSRMFRRESVLFRT